MAMSGTKLHIGVIGMGRMGMRWAQVASRHAECELVAICDADATVLDKAQLYLPKVYSYTGWEQLLYEGLDAIVVAVPHVHLTPIAQACLYRGKHVFCEKPGGVSSKAVAEALSVARAKKLQYRVNFHLRLHPAIAAAKAKVEADYIGPIISLKATFGHPGRQHYHREWWCDPAQAGGGELLDQGSHLIDLAHWFLGPMASQHTVLQNAYWDTPSEDNAFLLLTTAKGQTAQLHASWTHWHKMFRLELCGESGYLRVDGLGGLYGPEQLTYGPRPVGDGMAPREQLWNFAAQSDTPDTALIHSWDEFVRSIQQGSPIGPSAIDAVKALEVIERGYEQQPKFNPKELHYASTFTRAAAAYAGSGARRAVSDGEKDSAIDDARTDA